MDLSARDGEVTPSLAFYEHFFLKETDGYLPQEFYKNYSLY